MVTVFSARKIITMDTTCPEATHVAIRDGIVVGLGGPDCGDGWGRVVRDDRFAGHVILPGLIEAHAHVMAGGVWRFTYCGHYPRTDPDGTEWAGVGDYDALVARLREVAARTPPGAPVVGWGFDPNFLDGPRLGRARLDEVSAEHPVAVAHSNFHLLSANSLALERAGIDAGTNIEGVVRGPDGAPDGELQEFAAMGPVMDVVGLRIGDLSDRAAVETYGRVARGCGVTTVADLLSDLDEPEVAMLEQVAADPAFPARYVPIMNAMRGDPGDEARRAMALRGRSTPKLHLGRAKLFTDGAIQGFTAKLLPPGYMDGPDNGIWNMTPEHFREAVLALHMAGVKTHTHTNGDAASLLGIEAYEAALLRTPDADHRHVLEHVQLADRAQFLRMRALGLRVNVFTNHIHYFGDLHISKTVGPGRAARMNAGRDACDVWDGLFAIHSDAPVTPMAPLFTAWIAANRVTQGGAVLGPAQRLTAHEALRCITLGAAHVLKMDDQVGSLTVGKRGDLTVLDGDPLAGDPMGLKDIPVVATVLGGEVTA